MDIKVTSVPLWRHHISQQMHEWGSMCAVNPWTDSSEGTCPLFQILRYCRSYSLNSLCVNTHVFVCVCAFKACSRCSTMETPQLESHPAVESWQLAPPSGWMWNCARTDPGRLMRRLCKKDFTTQIACIEGIGHLMLSHIFWDFRF